MDVDAGIVDHRVKAFLERRRADMAMALGTSQTGDEHRLKSASFTALCLQAVLRVDEDEAIDCLTDGSDDVGIDSIHIGDITDGEFLVTIAQAKYSKNLAGTSGYPATAIGKIVQTVGHIFDPRSKLRMHRRLEEQVAEVRGLILNGNIPQVRVLLCSNGKTWEPNGQNQIDASGLTKQRVTFTHISHRTLIRLQTSKKSTDAHLKLSGKAVVDDFDHRRVLVGRLPVSQIKMIFDTHGDTLLDRNIRRYLGVRDNRVNSGIQDTLADPKSRSDFYFFNNGITAICTKFSHNGLQSEDWDVKTSGLQIVNGGQTCKTIQRTLHDHANEDYSKTYVLLRLYELADEDDKLIGSVTFATNSQNPVDLTDLRSNDSVQERLSESLRDLGFEYKRKRDEQAASAPEVITSSVAAESVMAVWRRKPHSAKFGKAKLFGDFYDDVFDRNLQAAHVVLSVLIYRMVESERKRPKQKRPRFVAYASHYLAMVVGDLLLAESGLQHSDVSHENLGHLRTIFEANRTRLYEAAIKAVEQALRKIGVPGEAPLPRMAAQFRRVDLVEPLQSAVAQAAKKKTGARKATSSGGNSKRSKMGGGGESKDRPTHRRVHSRRPDKLPRSSARSTSLNDKESAVLRALSVDDPQGLSNLARLAFPSEARGNSWVRNSLRKLRETGLARRVGAGTYVAVRNS
jgi:hypothetical protein